MNNDALLSRGAQLRAKYAEEAARLKLRNARREASEPPHSGAFLLELLGSELGPTVARDDAVTLVKSAADVIAKSWLERGGAELPPIVDRILFSIAAELSKRSVRAEWDRTDDEGMPYRPDAEGLKRTFYSIAKQGIGDAVGGRLAYDTSGWGDLPTDRLLELVSKQFTVRKKEREQARAALERAARSLASWQALHPAPPAQLYGMSPNGAELWVRDWMVHMGAVDAEVTRRSWDGGVDVLATGWAAQVKLYQSAASMAEIRELIGAAAVLSGPPRTLFFCSGGFPTQAEAFADQVGMALLRFTPETGEVVGENGYGAFLVKAGLLVHPDSDGVDSLD